MKLFNVDVVVNLIRKILGSHFIESATINETKSDTPSPKFEGIDVESALENWREMRVYQTYLIQFLNDFKSEPDDLVDFVHKIKGAARALGLCDVSDATEELEIIADENQNTDDAIRILKKAVSIASHLIIQHL